MSVPFRPLRTAVQMPTLMVPTSSLGLQASRQPLSCRVGGRGRSRCTGSDLPCWRCVARRVLLGAFPASLVSAYEAKVGSSRRHGTGGDVDVDSQGSGTDPRDRRFPVSEAMAEGVLCAATFCESRNCYVSWSQWMAMLWSVDRRKRRVYLSVGGKCRWNSFSERRTDSSSATKDAVERERLGICFGAST